MFEGLFWQHQNKPELKAEGESRCTMELEPSGPAVNLSITHTIEREPSKFIMAASGASPMIISNLKSLLETAPPFCRTPSCKLRTGENHFLQVVTGASFLD